MGISREGLLVAGISLAVAGLVTIGSGYYDSRQQAPLKMEDSKQSETKMQEPEKINSEQKGVISKQDKEKLEVIKDQLAQVSYVENGKVKRVKDIKELKSNAGLDNNIKSLLTKWGLAKDRVLKTLITENLGTLNGIYVYSANISKVGEIVSIDLGLSKEQVPKKNIKSYKDLSGKKGELEENANALALVDYSKGKVISAHLFQTDYSLEMIEHAILKSDIKKEEFSSLKEQKRIQKQSFENLTVEDWKGMTLLTSREIINKKMFPIFVVPTSSLSESKDDFEGTFYYIVAGKLEGVSQSETVLRSYEGKTFKLDFGDLDAKQHVGKPVWLHIITQDGKVRNVETQPFDGANIKTMADGMMSFIGAASAELHKKDKAGEKDAK